MALSGRFPKPKTVAEFMAQDVVTIRASATIDEVAKTLVDRHISGAPVVDAEGVPVGVVSQTDLLASRVPKGESEPDAIFDDTDTSISDTQRLMRNPTAEMVMTPMVLSVSRDTDVRTAARIMVAEKVHRLLVTDGEKVVGIISTLDLLRALVEEEAPKAPGTGGSGPPIPSPSLPPTSGASR